MHELAVANGIKEIALSVVKEHGKHRVSAINLAIGALTCVDEQALRFVIGPVLKGTAAEEAEINIEIIEPVAECRSCGNRFDAEGYATGCPLCGEHGAEIIHGRELHVKSIEAE